MEDTAMAVNYEHKAKTTHKIKIWQLDFNIAGADRFAFMGYDFVMGKCGNRIPVEFYECTYECGVSYSSGSEMEVLNWAFEQFNIHRPSDFTGRSLSVSDVIQLGKDYYFIDSFGFKKVKFK